jgi:hypothetical protein
VKSSITIPCSCGRQIPLDISGSVLPDHAKCQACGATIFLIAPLGNIVTMLLLERARQELASGDITIAIALGAFAVEGEMAYLFFKWKGIESGKLPHTKEDNEKWEGEWQNMRSIGKRLDELSRLLTDRPFDEFATLNKQLLTPALTAYDPATSLKKFFQEQLFDKRNAIAHYGKIDFHKQDGERCLSSTSALVGLFHAMDKERIKRMDDDHKNARKSIPAFDS